MEHRASNSINCTGVMFSWRNHVSEWSCWQLKCGNWRMSMKSGSSQSFHWQTVKLESTNRIIIKSSRSRMSIFVNSINRSIKLYKFHQNAEYKQSHFLCRHISLRDDGNGIDILIIFTSSIRCTFVKSCGKLWNLFPEEESKSGEGRKGNSERTVTKDWFRINILIWRCEMNVRRRKKMFVRLPRAHLSADWKNRKFMHISRQECFGWWENDIREYMKIVHIQTKTCSEKSISEFPFSSPNNTPTTQSSTQLG